MASTDLNIPILAAKFIDYRNQTPGDSYNWSWIRPLSQITYLAIHHSAGPDDQSPEEIASYHINHNGWGGIGYHFVISKEGVVYYVGDIQTARANVANLNEQVIGICLIGNFTEGCLPTNQQIDSAAKLCDFLINHYPALENVTTWECVRGHKELPGQSTSCPGDNWPTWKSDLVRAGQASPLGGIVFNPPTPQLAPPSERDAQITELYRQVLGRDPDSGGLQTYTNSALTLDEIMAAMVSSAEHHNLIRLAKDAPSLQGQVAGLQETVNHQRTQIDSLQMSLASVNGQLISTKEALQQREAEIGSLRAQLAGGAQPVPTVQPEPLPSPTPQPKSDTTLTLIDALINLYRFIFPPRKVE